MKRSSSFVGPGVVAVLLLIVGTTWIAAQAPSDPSMVYVRVALTNRDGKYISGLPREAFKISEGNVPQDVTYFSAEDSSRTIAVLIDADARIRDQVGQTIISELTRQISRDEIYLVESSGEPLNDAVYEALNELLGRTGDKRALILVTTTTNPESRSFSKVKEFLKRQDVRLYVIAVPAPNTSAAQEANPLLKELAEVSGGTAFFPVSMRPLPQVYHLIATDLRNQYVLGYRPESQTPDGKWRKVKINAQLHMNGKTQNFAVKARAGYYATASTLVR